MRVLPACGHGFCKTCINETWQYNMKNGIRYPPCPMCRVPFKPAHAIQIFLQSADGASAPNSTAGGASSSRSGATKRLGDVSSSTKSKVKSATEKLKRLDAESTEDEVRGATQTLLRAIDLIARDRGNADIAQNLLVAQYNLILQTVPLLRQSREHLEQQAVLQAQYERERKLRKEALDLMRQLKDQVDIEKKRVGRRNTKIAELEDALSQRQTEVETYADALQRYNRKEERQNNRIKGLQEDVQKRDDKIFDLEERLQYHEYFATSSDDESFVEDAQSESGASILSSDADQSDATDSENESSETLKEDNRSQIPRCLQLRCKSAGDTMINTRRRSSPDERSPSPRPVKRYRIVGRASIH